MTIILANNIVFHMHKYLLLFHYYRVFAFKSITVEIGKEFQMKDAWIDFGQLSAVINLWQEEAFLVS